MKLWYSRSLSFVLLLGLSTASASENARDNRKVSLGLIAGMPDMIGVQVKAEGVPNFEFGGSIGSFSMDPILRSRVPLSGVPVNLGLPDSYEIVPTASFNLFDVSIFARYFPWSTGFFTQIGFDWWHFGTNFTGDLKDINTGISTSGVVTGTLDLKQPMLSPSVGYQFFLSDRFVLDTAAGLSFHFPRSFPWFLKLRPVFKTLKQIFKTKSMLELRKSEIRSKFFRICLWLSAIFFESIR
jgi:hypothetical protein